MKTFIATIFITLSLMIGTAQAAVQTIKVQVNGMVCAFCAQGIDKKIRALPQTKDVYVNLKQKIVAVELKEGQTLLDSTVKDLIKDAGYDVTEIETVDQSLEHIKSTIGKQ